MTICFGIVRPKHGPSVIRTCGRRSNGKPFIVEIGHSGWALKAGRDTELAVCLDSQNYRPALAGVVAHHPQVVAVSIEREIHYPGQPGGNRRNSGELPVTAMIEGIGIDHSIGLQPHEKESCAVARILCRIVRVVLTFVEKSPGGQEAVGHPGDPFHSEIGADSGKVRCQIPLVRRHQRRRRRCWVKA